MDAIAVADDGSLTVGVSRCHDPVSHEALMTALPGAARLTVRASYAGGTPQQWQISPNGRVFAGCGTVRRQGRTVAQLSLIDSRSPERVRTAQLSATSLPFCVASDAGTASMAAVRSDSERHSPLLGITIGAGRPRRFSLSSDCGNGTGLDVSSPNGTQVITALYVARLSCRSQRATIIKTTNGRTRSFRHPFGDLKVASGRLGLNSGFWGPAHFWDPFAPALVQLDTLTGTVGIFDPSTLTETRPLRVLPTASGHVDEDISPCFLPSGRVLFVGQAPSKYALVVTNTGRTAVTPIDTSQTGPIASTSCDAAATNSEVFLSTSAGRIYAVAENALDGGALQITSGSLAGAPRTDRRSSRRT